MATAFFNPAELPDSEVSRRRHRVLTLLLLLTGPGVLLIADLHWRTGYDAWKVLDLLIFSILFLLVALGSTHSIIGFALRRRGGDPCRIVDSLDPDSEHEIVHARTAVVMPICNEDVERVMEGLRAIYQSLERNGRLPECHFFILSDSTNPNCWIDEEAAWVALVRELGAQGRIFYRKRRTGINKKAGNLADFCRRWGKLYRYMVVLDADSIMTGEAIVRMVQMMEQNRRVGIIQSVPLLVNGETVLARLQQFASRLYGPISVAGLNYWQLSEANYWGHNAIIRLAPFIRHCSLPELPGDGPFGGRILSHDFVEAALMRRAGWEVWLATEMEGNYEECPPTLIDLAQRDRRWLQGNLQHARLVVARGFHTANRIHFLLGIFSYLASPLWLAFLLVSMVIAASYVGNGPLLRPVSSFAAYIPWSYRGEALCLFFYTMVLLFLPKILSLFDLRSRPEEVAAFGGWGKLMGSVATETLVFTLLAPILMLFHTWFIALTLIGKKITWGAQRRGGSGEWSESVNANIGQTFIGLLGAFVACEIDPYLAFWMSPILLGLIFSIPLSYFTGSVEFGETIRHRGIFQTIEEVQPLPEIVQLAEAQANRHRGSPPRPELKSDYGLMQAVLDPYVNAVHVSLLRAKDDTPPANRERFQALRTTLLAEGPAALSPRDRIALLMDADSMHALHQDLWATPSTHLAEWWQFALQHYNRLAPAPQTAFSH